MAETKLTISAEDRTAAAFASVGRNADNAGDAMRRLTSTALKLAGAGTLIAFFRANAESTEKWRDEMAKLDEATKKFFNTTAESGDLDPLINSIKIAYSVATGTSIALIKLGQGVAAFARDVKLLFTDFSKSGSEMAKWKKSVDEADERFKEFNKNLFTDAPKGYAKQVEDAAARAKEAARKMREAEEERRKATLSAGKPAEDAFRAETELGEDQTAAGLTVLGEAVFSEGQKKRQEATEREMERLAELQEKRKEMAQREIENLRESMMTEDELELVRFEQKKLRLAALSDAEVGGAEQRQVMLEEMELQHQARIGNIDAQGILARRRFEEMNTKQKTSFVLSEMLQLTTGVAAHNKTFFNLNKALALANLAVEMPDAIGKAVSRGGGMPWGAVFGALTAAKYIALISQTKAAKFGSSTSAPSIEGGGAVPVTPALGIPDLSSAQSSTPRQQINLYVQSDSGMVTTQWLVDQFAPRWNEAVGDGMRVNVVAA